MYLQSASGRIPELQRVIVASGDQVAMAANLGLALVELFGRGVLSDDELAKLATFGGEAALPVMADMTAPQGGAGTATTPGTALGLDGLVQQANAQFADAQAAAQAGDWTGYGAALAELQATLEALAEATGVALPTPQPAPPPVPGTVPATPEAAATPGA
jgi:uncharacterized membrane protein (UPF0182 family)